MGKIKHTIRTGDTFNNWMVIEDISYRRTSHCLCLCQCCNKTKREISKHSLINGITKSCGCIYKKYNIEIGKIYGNWLVIMVIRHKNKVNYLCQCQCKNKTERKITAEHLASGHSKSCGCIRRIAWNANTTLDEAIKTIINISYNEFKKEGRKRNIKINLTIGEYALLIQQNCYYSKLPPYDLLSTKMAVSNFNKENGIIKTHSLDRIDNNGIYELGNIVSCDYFINGGKNDRIYKEFITWIKNIKIDFTPKFIKDLQDLKLFSNQIIKHTFPMMFYNSSSFQNYILHQISQFKNGVRKKNRIVKLLPNEIIMLKLAPCILCGRKVNIDILKSNHKYNDRSQLINTLNHIDRWDNSINEYNYNNCTTLCKYCNIFKNNQSINDFTNKINYLKQNYDLIPKTIEEILLINSYKNTINKLINLVDENKIIDYFNELPNLKNKLNEATPNPGRP